MYADFLYQDILHTVQTQGVVITSRNAVTKSCIDLPAITFKQTPLVTVRKTAWKLALKEMEWFVSGKEKCPEELKNWWAGQLNSLGEYVRGYSSQFRHFGCFGTFVDFDQIDFILKGLQTNPNSRRLILTTWNPYDMAHIVNFNNNPNTPTCCHTSLAQFFVRQDQLYMTSYQRSADLLLGVPHNWIQSWGLLLWLAHHSNLKVGHLRWIFGDAHIYQVDSHLKAVDQILNERRRTLKPNSFTLNYAPTDDGKCFKADDFVMEGDIPGPVTIIKPELL